MHIASRYLKVLVLLAIIAQANDESCETNSDCRSLNTCKGEICVHDDLFPLDEQVVGGTFAIIFFAALSNVGGIGGGEIMVPLCIIILSFGAHSAIPISQSIIFGGSLIAFAMKVLRRHPHKDCPLIDYKIAMHFMAPMLLGTSVGVIFNTIFPEWLILFLLTILVTLVAVKIFKRGINAWKAESRQNEFKRSATNRIWNSEKSRKTISPETVVAQVVNQVVSSDASPDDASSPNEMSDEGNVSGDHSEDSSDVASDADNSSEDHEDIPVVRSPRRKQPDQISKIPVSKSPRKTRPDQLQAAPVPKSPRKKQPAQYSDEDNHYDDHFAGEDSHSSDSDAAHNSPDLSDDDSNHSDSNLSIHTEHLTDEQPLTNRDVQSPHPAPSDAIIVEVLDSSDVTTKKDNQKLDKTMAAAKELELYSTDEELAKAKISKTLHEIETSEASTLPKKPLLIIAISLSIVICYSLMKGGKGMDSIVGITPCSGEFAGLLLGFVAITAGMAFLTGYINYQETQRKDYTGYNWWQEDIHWTKNTVLKIPIAAFSAGTLAGLMGIGGGLIMGPFLMGLGVNAQVSVATSSFMVLFTSSVSILQFSMGGVLPIDYALWCAGSAAIGSFLGVFVLQKIVEKFNRVSLVVLTLGFVLAFAATVIPALGVYTQIQKSEEGTAQWGFSDMC